MRKVLLLSILTFIAITSMLIAVLPSAQIETGVKVIADEAVNGINDNDIVIVQWAIDGLPDVHLLTLSRISATEFYGVLPPEAKADSLQISILPGQVKDLAGNLSITGQSITIDSKPPQVRLEVGIVSVLEKL